MEIGTSKAKTSKLIMITVLVIAGVLLVSLGYFLGNKNGDKVVTGQPSRIDENQKVDYDIETTEENDEIKNIEVETKVDSNIEKEKIENIEDDFADWETYTSKANGFNIKYPQEWTYELTPEHVGSKVVFSSGITINTPDPEVGYQGWKVVSTQIDNLITTRTFEPIKGNEDLGNLIMARWNKGGDDYFTNTGRLMLNYQDSKDERINTFYQMLSTLEFSESNSESTAWRVYKNEKFGFEINYPNVLLSNNTGNKKYAYNEAWEFEESADNKNISFGTKSSKSGGYIWGIYKKNSLNECGSRGTQFADRKEANEEIKIGEINATLITVTTDSNPDWISKVICITDNNNIFEIGNGAIDLSEFNTFYNSFRFL